MSKRWHNIKLPKGYTFTIHTARSRQGLELWTPRDERLYAFYIYWSWMFSPKCWWWWHNNGAVKGVDKCYDFNFHFFIFAFSYTNFAFWKYIPGRDHKPVPTNPQQGELQ